MAELIIGRPKHGWIDLGIKEGDTIINIPCSYLTDVPLDILNTMIVSLEMDLSFCLEIDAEGKGQYCIVNSHMIGELWVIEYDSLKRFDSIDVNLLGHQVYDWAQLNKKEIYDWFGEDELTNEEYVNRIQEIDNQLSKLKNLLDSKKRI